MKPLQDKIVMITGASSGIGEALARECAANGARVALLARRTDRIQKLEQEINQSGGKALAIYCDVKQENDLKSAVNKIHEHFGIIDIVVANAGFGVIGKFEDLTVADYQRQFDTNVFGVLKTIYATLDDLKKTKGQVVIMGSVAAYISVPTSTPYSMSKAAIKSFAEALYAELGLHKISVTLLSPGFIKSEIRHVDIYGVYQEKGSDRIPPWIRVDTPIAAKKMVNAIIKRKRESVITGHGKFFVFLYYVLPGVIPRILKWVGGRKVLDHK